MKLQKLTPKILGKTEYETYSKALDSIFEDSEITNVAITGSYGSGKSSIIESYKEHNKKIYINISLANFEEKNVEQQELYLEKKILNQFIQQIDYSKIPHKYFKVSELKKAKKNKSLKFIAAIGVATFLYLRHFTEWSDTVALLNNTKFKSLLEYTTTEEAKIIAFFFLIAVAIYGVIKFIGLLENNVFLQRIKIGGTEIEVSKENEVECSYFDNYLDEIVHTFLHSGVDVVIFEDIDRYNNTLIFNKLREINKLVNVKRFQLEENKENQKPIRFLYLLRDDLFDSKKRTKFFDLIIPIIPVIDGTNSIDKIFEILGDEHSLVQKNKKFLYKLSLYIDDMRLLKNIINEFLIYSEVILGKHIKEEKLLSIIVYKNVFPDDFSKSQLGLGRGILNRIFESRDEINADLTKKIDDEIMGLECEMAELEKIFTSNIDELDALYIKHPATLTVNGYEASTLGNLELVKKLKNENVNATYRTNPYNTTMQKYNISNCFAELDKNEDYRRNKNNLKVGKDNRISEIRKRILTLESEKIKIVKLPLFEAIKNSKIDDIFAVHTKKDFKSEENKKLVQEEFEKMKSSSYFPLLKFLVRNGFIDESYKDYMTYFYENSLSQNGKLFVRSLGDAEGLPFDFSLINEVEMVLTRLEEMDFTRIEILNFDLLDYLFDTKNSHYRTVLSTVVENIRPDFIHGYIENISNEISSLDESSSKSYLIKRRRLFFKCINDISPDIWKSCFHAIKVTEKNKLEFLYNTFVFSSISAIKDMNRDNELTEYLNENTNSLDVSTTSTVDVSDVEVIKNVFVELEINLRHIGRANKELLMIIYENTLYEINYHNVGRILEEIYGVSNEVNNQYSKVYDLKESKLLRSVHNKINRYVSSLLEENTVIEDSESAKIALLNDKKLDEDRKIDYIDISKTIVTDVGNISEQSLRKHLLDRELVEYSVPNILAYYFANDNTLDSTLVSFINSNESEFDFDEDEIEKAYGYEKKEVFFFDVIQSNGIDNDKYFMVLEGYEHPITNFDFSGIESEKMLILINLRIIKMDAENLKFMRINYKDEVFAYITKEITEYIEITSEEELFDNNEAIQLINYDKVSSSKKLEIVKRISTPIPLDIETFSSDLVLHILKNNFDLSDLPLVCNDLFFSNTNDSIKQVVKTICINHTHLLGNVPVCFEILFSVFESEGVPQNEKIRLFKYHASKLDIEQSVMFFDLLGLVGFIALLSGGNPTIENTSENVELLELLKQKEWISSYKEIGSSKIQAFSKRNLR